MLAADLGRTLSAADLGRTLFEISLFKMHADRTVILTAALRGGPGKNINAPGHKLPGLVVLQDMKLSPVMQDCAAGKEGTLALQRQVTAHPNQQLWWQVLETRGSYT